MVFNGYFQSCLVSSLIGLAGCLQASVGLAQTIGKKEASDVFVRVAVVRAELESIRFVMGRSKNNQPEIDVSGAEPREVYFQALTLFRKADRLCFERTREREAEPKAPTRSLTPTDVYGVVDAALKRIRRVKKKLGIDKQATPPARDKTKTPTDVFQSCVQASRQLNLLLDRQFTPSDVFQQVTRSVAFASRLLERFPDAETIPDEPEFEPAKRPADVYGRLVSCFKIIKRVAENSGENVLGFDPDQKLYLQAEPSDVYDIASLLISELSYLHSKLPSAKPPHKVYYPGRKFPSHVFQRAGMLERQLTSLEALVGKNRDWLKPGSGGQ